jgi:site-specific recombinase XerC
VTLVGLRVDDIVLRDQIAFVLGKGERGRACPFGAKTAQRSTDTCASVVGTKTRTDGTLARREGQDDGFGDHTGSTAACS